LPSREVAKLLGCSKTTVANLLKPNGHLANGHAGNSGQPDVAKEDVLEPLLEQAIEQLDVKSAEAEAATLEIEKLQDRLAENGGIAEKLLARLTVLEGELAQATNMVLAQQQEIERLTAPPPPPPQPVVQQPPQITNADILARLESMERRQQNGQRKRAGMSMSQTWLPEGNYSSPSKEVPRNETARQSIQRAFQEFRDKGGNSPRIP